MQNRVYEKMKDVIQCLPDWKLEGPLYDRGAIIHHRDTGAEIYITEDWRNKVEAAGSFPQDENGSSMSASSWGMVPYGCQGPRIGFNIAKAPHLIAKDIVKRLESEYVPMYMKVKAKLAERVASKIHRQKALEDFAEYVGEKVYSGRVTFYADKKEDIYCEANVNYDGKVKLELTYVTIEQAKQIYDILREGK